MLLLLDILFKLAVLVVCIMFVGIAYAANKERQKFAKANDLYTQQMKAQLDDAARRERATVLAVAGPWLHHTRDCVQNITLQTCTCGLREALISLELPH